MSVRRRILVGLLGIAFAGLLAFALCPKPALYGDTDFSLAIMDRNGELLRLFLADDDRYRLKTPLDAISDTAVRATLLYEDKHFRSHFGINPASLFRAAWSTWISRQRVMGASTITMQLARLRFDLDTRSIGGKLTQMGRALQLERHYSKDAILEAYLNLAPYGGNVEGIGTASLIYFGKPAGDLSLTEALALAVIPQNPAQRNPSTAAGHERMQAARLRLLDIWSKYEEVDDEIRALFTLPLAARPSSRLPFRAPHFSQAVADGRSGQGALTTTLDASLQTLLESRIDGYVERFRSRGIRNAAAMLIDHRSMHLLASVGSANFFDATIAGQVDGTAAKRSPGSTLKPFVYGMAIDRGIVHPGSMLKDAPTRFAAYTPENFDRGFMGPIKTGDALIYSRNVPAIHLLSRVGHGDFHRFLIDAGIDDLRDPDFYGLAMILGGNELTMQEIVTLYAMLANRGTLRPIVRTPDTPPATDGVPLLSPEASFLTLDMLRKNPRPGALSTAAAKPSGTIAWKTGTSFAFRDAWTAGVFGPYVLAVWVGNFDGAGNPAFVGRSAAAPLFFEIADTIAANSPADAFDVVPSPDLNLQRVDICADTGDLPGRHCPRTEKSWFIPGVSPISVSRVHRAVRIDIQSGLRACRFDPATTREEVFEFWPSDILALYRQAGVAIQKPPRWSSECDIDAQAAHGLAPEITSPVSGLTYLTDTDSDEDRGLALQATTDAGVEDLYWFVDDRLVAEVGRNETFFWKPSPGTHRVLAVDDLGRSHSRRITVSAAH